MNFVVKVTILIGVLVSWNIVKCLPRNRQRNIDKKIILKVSPLPLKHYTFVLEKVKPFGKFELKHVIHKRQIVQTEVPPVPNEIRVNDVIAFEDFAKPPEVIEKKEEGLVPEVLITSIIKPIENSKSFSFVLPEESEVFIRPADKGEIIKEPAVVPDTILPEPIFSGPIIPESVSTPVEVARPLEHVVEITPKPIIIPPPPESQHMVQNVEIKTPIESTVPPLPVRIPLFQNLNGPVPRPVVNNIPNPPLLYTDITQIPLNGVPYPTPVGIPIPEFIPPPPPLPPPVKEPPVIKEPPIIKEQTPNFLVKGSRFVLYFGSMILQMLSQLVNGQINLNQPLPAVIPGL